MAALGCGGSSNSTTQQMRVVMASATTPPVDILIDSAQVATSLAFTNFMPYTPVKTGQHHVQGLAVANSASLFQQTVAVTASSNLSIYVTATGSKPATLVLTDGAGTATNIVTGDGSVRIINASSNMGPADVYLVNAGSGIGGVTPVSASLPFNQTTGYQQVAIGNYQVFMTAPGTSNVFLDTGPLALTQSQYQTVVAVDGANGGFNYIVLPDQ
ncbi:MAG TPA: DUF4397 domain-containing protein [Terriglobales bacterium]|nr:DUF4397 domain-containing protein [Terriglobales bacterium]